MIVIAGLWLPATFVVFFWYRGLFTIMFVSGPILAVTYTAGLCVGAGFKRGND